MADTTGKSEVEVAAENLTNRESAIFQFFSGRKRDQCSVAVLAMNRYAVRLVFIIRSFFGD